MFRDQADGSSIVTQASVIVTSGEEQRSALDHEYFYSEETHLTFSSSCISQSKSHASLTSKRDWEVQSYAVIRKEKADIEGNHSNC